KNNSKAFPIVVDLDAEAVAADAGPDQWITSSVSSSDGGGVQFVTLDGSASRPANKIKSYRWLDEDGDQIGTSATVRTLIEAIAPAQVVSIVNQLSPHFDWDTFQINEVGWGQTRLNLVAKTQHSDTTVPVTIAGKDFDVRIQTELDYATGIVTILFQSIDPLT